MTKAEIKKKFDNLTIRVIMVTGLNIENPMKTLMPFQDTMVGAIKSTLANTPPLHGAN